MKFLGGKMAPKILEWIRVYFNRGSHMSCDCNDKKIAAAHDAIKGCNANLNKALQIIDKVVCESSSHIEFDVGPITKRTPTKPTI